MNVKKKLPPNLLINVNNQDSDEESKFSPSLVKKAQTEQQDGFLNNHTRVGKSWDVSIKKCQRDQQCDRFQIQNPLRPNKREAYFAVYDGHLTDQVACYLEIQMHQTFIQHEFFDIEGKREQALRQSCETIDYDILHKKQLKGGSTAVMAIVIEQKLYIVNVGDSWSKMVKMNKEIKPLNRKHELSDEQEKQQLVQKGACILDRGGIQRINGKLAVSRSFGDPDYKEYISCEPDISMYDLNTDDKYLMLASDGFWEYMPDQRLQDYLNKYENIKNQNQNNNNINNNIIKPDNDIVNEYNGENNNELSRYLLDIASDMTGSQSKKDNMTLIVVDIQSLLKEMQLIPTHPNFNNNNGNSSFSKNLMNLNTDSIQDNSTGDQMSAEVSLKSVNNEQKQSSKLASSSGKISPEVNDLNDQQFQQDYTNLLSISKKQDVHSFNFGVCSNNSNNQDKLDEE